VPYKDLEGDEGPRVCGAACWSATNQGDDQILLNIKKGVAHRQSQGRFNRRLPQALGNHDPRPTFILGLPGETKETIESTIEFRQRRSIPHTIPGIAGGTLPPGTTLYKAGSRQRAGCRGKTTPSIWSTTRGVQGSPPFSYPHLSKGRDISQPWKCFYKRFYFRPSKIWENRQGKC